MSISHRKFRALVLEYNDAGADGVVDSTYLERDSGAADKRWWCSRSNPTGREVTTGMQPDHRVDAVLGFSAACPIELDDAVEVDGESYVVRAILARKYGHDEVLVAAERIAEQTLTQS